MRLGRLPTHPASGERFRFERTRPGTQRKKERKKEKNKNILTGRKREKTEKHT
jgi:hypothetical protein